MTGTLLRWWPCFALVLATCCWTAAAARLGRRVEENGITRYLVVKEDGNEVMLEPLFQDDNDLFPVMIRYRDDADHAEIFSAFSDNDLVTTLQEGKVVAVKLTADELAAVQADPNVVYIEPDLIMYPLEESSVTPTTVYQFRGLRKNTTGKNSPLEPEPGSPLPSDPESGDAPSHPGPDNPPSKNTGRNSPPGTEPQTDNVGGSASSVTSIPYGIAMVQGGSFATFGHAPSENAACSNPNTFRIAIVDSGVDPYNTEIPCGDVSNAASTRCIGSSFGLSRTQTWDRDSSTHGTHVTGTIGSYRYGVMGPDSSESVCYIIARVFGDSGGASYSNIMAAVEWATNQGAKVINMSLGGGGYSQTSQDTMTWAWQRGAMVIAAAGNNGSTKRQYPASYNNVMSVAAVDKNMVKASFSDQNDRVDMAGPGVDVLSTAPGNGGIMLASNKGNFFGQLLDFSVAIGSRQGLLVDCGLGTSQCVGVQNAICLIKRGSVTFQVKAKNCQAGGGIAAVMYNNVDAAFAGSLGNTNTLTIPAVSISGVDGTTLMQNSLGTTVVLGTAGNTKLMSGTSMATPHVAGAAGRIWSVCPKCTNARVTYCLQTKAKDLGSVGRDNKYGYGLVQVNAAFDCLRTSQCCASSTTIPDPVNPSPSASPSKAPSKTPSASPTMCFHPLDATPLTGKRGIGMTMRDPAIATSGTWTENVPKVRALNPSWHVSYDSVRTAAQNDLSGIEFVPMIWSYYNDDQLKRQLNEDIMPEYLAGHVHRFLTFYEPDIKNASPFISVEQVVKVWPTMTGAQIPMASPTAMQPNGNWMSKFITTTKNDCLRMEYVAFKWIKGPDLQLLKRALQRVHLAAPDLPILITALGVADYSATSVAENRFSAAQVLAYMKQAVPWLESQSWIAGYAWYNFASNDAAGAPSALFDASNALTALGQYYASVTPAHPYGNQTVSDLT